MTKPVLRQTGPGIFEMGGVTLNQAKKTVAFPGEVNMSRGLLEYAIVGAGGKLHESLLRTEVEPYHIHLAILLLSAKQPDPKKEKAPGPPAEDFLTGSLLAGPPITIWVQLQGDKPEPPVRLENWIRFERTGAVMSQGPWIYNGSRLMDGRFIAHLERSIASIIEDGYALINNPQPGRESDELGSPNQALVPPVGTPVLITLQINPPGAGPNSDKGPGVSPLKPESSGPAPAPAPPAGVPAITKQ